MSWLRSSAAEPNSLTDQHRLIRCREPVRMTPSTSPSLMHSPRCDSDRRISPPLWRARDAIQPPAQVIVSQPLTPALLSVPDTFALSPLAASACQCRACPRSPRAILRYRSNYQE